MYNRLVHVVKKCCYTMLYAVLELYNCILYNLYLSLCLSIYLSILLKYKCIYNT